MVNSREILRRLMRRFGLLILLTLIGGIAGALYSAVKTPTYTAKAYVVATGDRGDSITALNYAQAYGRIATSGPVLAKAGALLGADRSGLSDVTAATSPDAPVIELTATGTKADRTAAVANAMAKALADYGTARKADTHVGLSVLAGAVAPAKPTSPKPPMELAVGAAGGLLIGGLAVLAGVGRPAARRDEEEPVRAPAETAPARYEAEVDEPSDQPISIERYTGVARAEQAPKAIASYRASAAPAYLDAEEEPDDGDEPVPATIPVRIVGRAQVAGTKDDE